MSIAFHYLKKNGRATLLCPVSHLASRPTFPPTIELRMVRDIPNKGCAVVEFEMERRQSNPITITYELLRQDDQVIGLGIETIRRHPKGSWP